MAGETVPTPSGVREFATRLAEDTGTTPAVTWEGGHRWRVQVDNGRVRMWVTYEALSRGRLKWLRSELFVNGEPVDRASGYADFLRIFHDGGELTHETVEESVSAAPDFLRRAAAKLTPRLASGTTLRILRTGPRWQLVVRSSRGCLRVTLERPLMDPRRPARMGEFKLRAERPVELELDGDDLTDEIQGRLDLAMARMVAHSHAAPPPQVSGTSAPQVKATGVQVRNTTVIRN